MIYHEWMRKFDPDFTEEVISKLPENSIPLKMVLGGDGIVYRDHRGVDIAVSVRDGKSYGQDNKFFSKIEANRIAKNWKEMADKEAKRTETTPAESEDEEGDKKKSRFNILLEIIERNQHMFAMSIKGDRNVLLFSANNGEVFECLDNQSFHAALASEASVVVGSYLPDQATLTRLVAELTTGARRLHRFEGDIRMTGNKPTGSHRVFVGDVLDLKEENGLWEKYKERCTCGTWANLRAVILMYYYGIDGGKVKSFFALCDEGDRGKTALLNAIAACFCVPRRGSAIKDKLKKKDLRKLVVDNGLLLEIQSGDDNHASEGIGKAVMIQANEIPFTSKISELFKVWTGSGTSRENPKGHKAHATTFTGVAFIATNRKFATALIRSSAVAKRFCPIMLSPLSKEELEEPGVDFSKRLALSMGFAVEMCVKEMEGIVGKKACEMEEEEKIAFLKSTLMNIGNEKVFSDFSSSGATMNDIDLEDVFSGSNDISRVPVEEMLRWMENLGCGGKRKKFVNAITEESIKAIVDEIFKNQPQYGDITARVKADIVDKAKEYSNRFIDRIEEITNRKFLYRGQLFIGLVPKRSLFGKTKKNSVIEEAEQLLIDVLSGIDGMRMNIKEDCLPANYMQYLFEEDTHNAISEFALDEEEDFVL